MRSPHPPFLELNFYFAEKPEDEAFRSLISALLDLGATFTGTAYGHLRKTIRNLPFASTTDEVLEFLPIVDLETFTHYHSNPHTRVVRVCLNRATGIACDVAEIVTYSGISRFAAETDHHPLSIWTDGDVFSGTLRQQFAQRRYKAGQQAYQRFCRLIEMLNPSYAAITSEVPLPCPTDLRRDPRTYAFRNFFVNQHFCDLVTFRRIQELFRSAYIQRVGDGVFISSTEDFNPQGISMNSVHTSYLSMEVAKLIAANS